MSVVTGVVLCTSCAESKEQEILANLNEWLKSRDFGELKQIDELFGGNKHPQMTVYGCGFNYFDADDFANFVMNQAWEYPGNVVLVMEPEEGRTKVWQMPQGMAESA